MMKQKEGDLMIKVADIMSTTLHTLNTQHSLADARKLMTEHGIRHIPIVDEQNNILGIVSQRDVLAAEESSAFKLSAEQRINSELLLKIDDFYHRDIATISANASVLSAALYIQKHKIGCLPVVSHGRLLGLVTDSDFVNVAINLLETGDDTY